MASVWQDMRLSKVLIYLAFSVQVLPICSQVNVPSRFASASLPQLWGDLQPGVFAVGFRTVFRYDDSRTWKLTRSYDGTFSPDLSGRPIQINIWYPATVDNLPGRMNFGDYVNQSAPEAFVELNNVMKQRSRDDAIGSVPHSEIPSLQSAEMNAYRDARLGSGRFPVVLYFGGLNGAINGNVILVSGKPRIRGRKHLADRSVKRAGIPIAERGRSRGIRSRYGICLVGASGRTSG
jgi:hypothetical protein